MPALTMRGRYLMREYWTDSTLFLSLTAEERELYIGLWMLADDDGWMPRDVPAIGNALMGFHSRETRERAVRAGLEHLRDLGKVLSYRCCLLIPAVARYPRPGKKTSEHRIEHERHQKHSNQFKPIQTDLNATLPDPTLPNLTNPDVAGARAPERRGSRGGPMTDAASAAGGFVAGLARKSA